MENVIQILGNESSAIYYNINKQFSTLKKLIITKEILLNSYENNKIKELIESLKRTRTNYTEVIKENLNAFDTNFNNELYKTIQELLNKISNSYMDVKIKDYNFMNSMSNTKFNIVLRCESYSITDYYQEKGTIISSIKNLIKKYLHFEGNIYRLSRLDNFQIEIFESEEIYKHIYLKKENNEIILASTYGFPKNTPLDHTIGSEFYISKGTDFKFFANTQNTAVIREHNKLVEKEINKQEKILTNEDLILINEKTKNIDEALIECYLTQKGHFRIINLSLIENNIGQYSENGFVINKSTNNYDRISILTLRDNFDDEPVNPTYLLLKNPSSVKELLENIKIINKIDGIILTNNFFSPLLDSIGNTKNIDILFFNKQLSKSLEEKIDWETLNIESAASSHKEANPFSGIISEQNKEKDEMLERLKNIDLSTPTREENNLNTNSIQTTVNQIISSKESSFNKLQNNGGNQMNTQKKSAIDMLMESAINQKKKNEETKNTSTQFQTQQPNTHKQEEYKQPFEQYSANNSNYNNNNHQSYSQQTETIFNHQTTQNNLNNHLSNDRYLNISEEYPSAKQTEDPFKNLNNAFNTTNATTNFQTPNYHHNSQSQYDNIWATEIIGDPNLDVDAYFVNQDTINQVRNGKTYFLTINPSEMRNPNLNYVLPIGLNNPSIKNCYLLINNINDYFLINPEQDVKYFVNITEINNIIKKNFLDEITNKVEEIILICNKYDLDLIEENIDKYKGIRVQDIESNDELTQIKRKIMQFEKKFLMKHCKEH